MNVDYTLIRSDRKTTAIRILPDGTVEVRAPRRLSKRAIEDFLLEKQGWIDKHRAEILARQPETVDPRRILYLGSWYDIQPCASYEVAFDGAQFHAPENMPEDALKHSLEALLKAIAKQYLTGRTIQIGIKMGAQPAKIGITSARTKWASCSGGTNINFSWRLMAAPPEVIDYVIVHELCHMTEMNHSARFWALVERHCPHWKELRGRLPEAQAWLEAYYGR